MSDLFDEECWCKEKAHLLSAELTTILKMTNQAASANVAWKQEDEVVFLCDKSNDREAYLNCAILRGLAGRVCKGVSHPLDLNPGHIGVQKVPHELNVGDEDAFTFALEHLRHAIIKPNRNNARWVLTGGYKGMILFIAHELGRESIPTAIYYLYEGSKYEGDLTIKRNEGALIALKIGDSGDMTSLVMGD